MTHIMEHKIKDLTFYKKIKNMNNQIYKHNKVNKKIIF